jgi:LAO/AO transport system kinase
MVDFFLLVFIAGAGDELQGIKKGVIEIADALLINKADGENETRANRTKTEFSIALHYLKPATKGWKTDAYTASAITGKGIRELWELILQFERVTKESGVFEERRKEQALDWTFSLIEEALREQFYQNQSVKTMLPKLRDDIKNGILLPTAAAEKLLRLFRDSD